MASQFPLPIMMLLSGAEDFMLDAMYMYVWIRLLDVI